MADEIIRLDYSAEDIGDNIDEVRTARGEYDSLDERLNEIEGGGPSPSNPIASNCVSPMTGYSKSSSSTPGNISTSDTLNAAIGKLEKRTELNENNILLNQNNGFLQKNLFAPTKQSDSFDGAVITAGSGGTYTITSTSQTTQSFVFTLGQFTGESGKTYYVSGCPISSNEISLRVGSNYYGEGIATYIGTGASVNVTISFLSDFYTDTPLVFKPMISESNDDTFVPYAMSNAELTSNILPTAFQAALPTPSNYVQIDGGGYARIGNLVIVQIRATWLQSCSEGSAIIQGLPKPLLNYDVYTAGASVVNNLHKNMSVMGNGTIAWVDGASPSSGGLVLSAVYICKD